MEQPRSVTSETKKSIVFIGTINEEGEDQIFGTGFLISVNDIGYLVTAKHVIFSQDQSGKVLSKRENLFGFINTKSSQIKNLPLNQIEKSGFKWIFHENPLVDIALIPFFADPDFYVTAFKSNSFCPIESIVETLDVIYYSFQPNVTLLMDDQCVNPIIRSGMISKNNDNGTFYIDGFAFPGNSGSPVFVKYSPVRIGENGVSMGSDPIGGRFLGVMGAYMPYQEVAISSQTGKPRVIFEENTGLSLVWSVSFLEEIINSTNFKQQESNILEGIEKTPEKFSKV